MIFQRPDQRLVRDVPHDRQRDLALQASACEAARGGHRVEGVLQQFGEGLGALAAQGLPFVAHHGQAQGGDRGEVLDDHESGGTGRYPAGPPGAGTGRTKPPGMLGGASGSAGSTLTSGGASMLGSSGRP
jgi:hypothetical protein